MDFQKLKHDIKKTSAFIVDEDAIIETLIILKTLQQADAKVLFSIKSLPLTSVLEMASPYVDGFSVSSLFEAQLVKDTLQQQSGSIHLTTPGIREDEIFELDSLCSHISFNSLNQYQRLSPLLSQASKGIRLNPKLSFLNDQRFNPCRQYSKLGVSLDDFSKTDCNIDGLHFHTVFSATDFKPLQQTIGKIENRLKNRLKQLKWINLGGGYLFNQIKDLQPLQELIVYLQHQYGVDVYLEPGKAIVGDAGFLITSVIDLFDSDGKTVAILDTSINHNPEVFEYQKKPLLIEEQPQGAYKAILAGSTCLAGDIFGEYSFNKALKIGDKLIFKEMGAYSLIKANRFNGYNLPDIYSHCNGQLKKIKQYYYQDYQQQWQVSP